MRAGDVMRQVHSIFKLGVWTRSHNPIDRARVFRRRAGHRCVLSPCHISRPCTISLCHWAHFISSLDWLVVLCPAASSHSLQCQSLLESYRRPALTRSSDASDSHVEPSESFSFLLHVHSIIRQHLVCFWSEHTGEVQLDGSGFYRSQNQESELMCLTWCLKHARNSFSVLAQRSCSTSCSL